MYDFKLTSDYQYIKLISDSTNKEIHTLKEYFRRQSSKFFFDPLFQKKLWDGYDNYYEKGFIPIGLWRELEKFHRNNGHQLSIKGLDKFLNLDFNKDEIVEFIADLLKDTEIFEPRWYQLEAAYRILKYRYSSLELATSAGKTLITFIVLAYLKQRGLVDKDRKFLIIVPRIGLVNQTLDKFQENYNNGLVPIKYLPMGGNNKFKQKLYDEADCIISTYQSLGRKNEAFFKPINHIYVDEGHTAQNNTVQKIINTIKIPSYKFGMSGTLEINPDKSEFFRMQKYLGPLVMVLTAKDLQDENYSPKVNIKIIHLNYDNSDDKIIEDYNFFLKNGAEQYADKTEFAKELYKIERQIIIEHEKRREFTVKLANSLDKNTLILFNNVKDKLGLKISEDLKKLENEVYYIDGSTKSVDREDYQDAMEKNSNVKLVASFGTFSTGMDLKNIYNIIFAESYKSPILIRQSIGRGMRELLGKYFINIIDIVDMFGKYAKKHAKERLGIYKKQKFAVETYEYDLYKK